MTKILTILLTFVTSQVYTQHYLKQSILNKSAESIINANDKRQVLESLDRFLNCINQDSIDHNVYDQEYYNTEKTLLFIPINKYTQKSTQNNNPYFFKPMINYAEKLDSNYLIKVAFIGIDSLNIPTLKLVQSFLLKKNNKNLYHVYSPFLHNIKDWKKHKTGSITYYYENNFHKIEAGKMLKSSKKLSKLFNIPEQEITYYKFKNSKDLFDQIGSDYIHNKYWSKTGGFVLDNNIYAGNNSEAYIHELVHIYTKAKEKNNGQKLNFWADEGLATYLGGSGTYTYNKLLYKLKNIDLTNRDLMKDLYNVYTFEETEENFPLGYALNGFIIDLIHKKNNKNLIFDFLYNAGDFKTYINLIEQHLNIKANNFTEDLLLSLSNKK